MDLAVAAGGEFDTRSSTRRRMSSPSRRWALRYQPLRPPPGRSVETGSGLAASRLRSRAAMPSALPTGNSKRSGGRLVRRHEGRQLGRTGLLRVEAPGSETTARRRVDHVGGAPAMACSRCGWGARCGGSNRARPRCGVLHLRNSTGVSAVLGHPTAYITAMRSARPATTPRSWVRGSSPCATRAATLRRSRTASGRSRRARWRLVGDEQLRIAGERDGDADALAHAARQLVGELTRRRSGSGCRRGAQFEGAGVWTAPDSS